SLLDSELEQARIVETQSLDLQQSVREGGPIDTRRAQVTHSANSSTNSISRSASRAAVSRKAKLDSRVHTSTSASRGWSLPRRMSVICSSPTNAYSANSVTRRELRTHAFDVPRQRTAARTNGSRSKAAPAPSPPIEMPSASSTNAALRTPGTRSHALTMTPSSAAAVPDIGKFSSAISPTTVALQPARHRPSIRFQLEPRDDSSERSGLLRGFCGGVTFACATTIDP